MSEKFSSWLQNDPLGQYILIKEQSFFDKTCQDIFGRYALQIGLCDVPFLKESRISSLLRLDYSRSANIIARAEAIPCGWRTIDLVVLPHTLELSQNPHQVLNEVQRVLVPGGKLIIAGFNPASFFGLRSQISSAVPPRNQMVGLWRLKDWFKLLGFEINLGEFMVYAPPFSTTKNLARFQFLEKAGNRWWPQLAGVYALVATKQVYNITAITPEWQKKSFSMSALPTINSSTKGVNND